MAVTIPIVSDFNGKGLEKAIAQFKDLETTGQRAQFALKKAAVPAAAALAGLAYAAFNSAKAAADDQAAQVQLARQLEATTGATNAQVKANEDFISTLSMSVAVADDQLRPALASLVRGTKDLATAQDMLQLSLDVSAGTGKNLQEVSDAVSKAFGGNTKAIKQLSPELYQLIKDGATTDQVMKALSDTFGGAAVTAANTAQGKFKKVSIAFGELQESIGNAVLPLIEMLIPALLEFGTWAQNHTAVIVGIATAIGLIAAAIVTANIAMAAWKAISIITAAVNWALAASFTAVQIATGIGIATVIAGIAAFALYKRSMNGMKADLGAYSDAQGYSNSQMARMSDSGKLATAAIDDFTPKVTGATTKVQSFAEAVKKKLGDALDEAKSKLDDAKTAFTDFAKSISDSLKSAFSFGDAQEAGVETGAGFLQGLREQVGGIIGYTKKIQDLLDAGLSQEALQKVLDSGQAAGTAIADQLIAGGSAAITETNDLVDATNAAAEKVGINAATKWYQKGIDTAQAMVNGITTALDDMTPKLMAKMDAIAAKMKRSVSVDVYVTEIVNKISASGIPKMANGGIVNRPTLALIGEAGPEAVVPLSKMGSTGGVTVNINGGFSTSAEIGQAVVNALRAFSRQNGPAQLQIGAYQ